MKNIGVIVCVVCIGFLGFLLYRSDGTQKIEITDPLLEVSDVLGNDEINNTNTITQDDNVEDLVEEIEIGFTTQQFVDAYQQSIDNRDDYLKYNLAQTLYEEYGDKRLLPTLVVLSLQHHRMKQALDYLMQTDLHNPKIHTMIGTQKILYILFNAIDLNPENLSMLKNLVIKYHEQGYIDTAQKTLYFSFIALTKGDFTNYEHFISQLEKTNQRVRRESHKNNKQTMEQYEYVPEYFLDGLEGITFFYQGWYAISNYLGIKTLAYDEKYILGYQLRSYSHLLLGERRDAYELLELLKQYDENPLYNLLQAVALFHNGVYAESILLLEQINEIDLVLDAKRYLLLSYEGVDDTKGMMKVLQEMIGHTLTSYDYFTIFDLMLFSHERPGEEYSRAQKAILQKMVDQCYADLGQTQGYICLYGKAGIHSSNGANEKALTVLSGLLNWYPTSQVYERMGDIHFRLGDELAAKQAYLKALTIQSGNHEEGYLREKIISAFSKQQ